MQQVLDFIESTTGVSPGTLEVIGLICHCVLAIYGAFKLLEDDPVPPAEANAGTQPHVEATPSAAPPTFRVEKSEQRRTHPQRFCLVCGRELKVGEIHGH